MNAFNEKLLERERSGNPVAVAVVGAGQMGTEIISQIGEMRGMDVFVVVDLTLDRAAAGYASSKKRGEVVRTDDLAAAEAAVAAGKRVATTDYRIATRLSRVEAVVDATGQAEMGAGDVFVIQTPSAGGYGPAAERVEPVKAAAE